MQRALELARRGVAVSSPNPAVGCVILDCAGQVAGEGWHEYDLVDHAEVVALKVAQTLARVLLGNFERDDLGVVDQDVRVPTLPWAA